MLFRAMLAFLVLLGAGAASARAEQTIIVLDASGSMWGQIDGKAKMDIARDTLDSVLESVPGGNALGLMVYGHREKGSCADIELAVPPAAGTGPAISAFVKGINPKGKTPLSASVRQAAEALKYTEDKATVILVTDGLETCEADPCALASELEKTGVDFTAHVVGFGLTDEEGRQVACLAENTGGKYLQAKDAGELSEALTETVAAEPAPAPAPPPEPAQPVFNVRTDAVLLEGGPSLGDIPEVRWDFYQADAKGEKSGDTIEGGYDATFEATIPPGSYIAVARLGELTRSIAFEVRDGAVAEPFVNFEAGILTLTPKRTADGSAEDSARLDISQGDFTDGSYGTRSFYVPAGEIDIKGKIGPAEVTDKVAVKAGETVLKDVVIGTGIVVTKAVYAEGGPDVSEDGIRFDVVSAKKDISGQREGIEGTYGVDRDLDVPAGEFVLTAKLGEAQGETPFTIKAGERIEVRVNINAGVLAITAPGANRIDIVSAKKDIQGRQEDVSGGYGEAFQETLPPGDYIVKVGYEGDKAPKEASVTVTAGERAEIDVQ